MFKYIIKRLLLIIPTLFGILLLNFAVIQIAPGGPVEQLMMQLEGKGELASSTAQFAGGAGEVAKVSGAQSTDYRGRRGLDPEIVQKIRMQYGFDKPAAQRFWEMLSKYVRFDFGTSFFQDKKVFDLLLEKLPVSISLGLWSTLLIYLVSVPLGIRKALQDGSKFDVSSSFLLVVFNSIPAFLLAIMLITLFAGGNYWEIFPLRGIVSDNWHELGFFAKIADYFWHMALPIFAMTIGGFAMLSMLTKNSFLDEISKQYVLTARAKGLPEKRVLYGHVFRNAMLIVISSFPAVLVGVLFAGSLLIEVIFSLDGLGLLSYEAVVSRDYPVFFASLYIFTLIGLLASLLRDLTYRLIDPRIDFEAQK